MWDYEIQGNYGQGYEMVTTEATMEEARETLDTYRANEPGIPFRIRKVRAA